VWLRRVLWGQLARKKLELYTTPNFALTAGSASQGAKEKPSAQTLVLSAVQPEAASEISK